jgi:MFS family permease
VATVTIPTAQPTTHGARRRAEPESGATSLLLDPAFRRLLAGRVLAALAGAAAPVLLAFAVLDRSSSASALGGVLAARSVPQLLLVLLGGVLADRLPRQRVAVAALAVAAASQGLVAAGILTGSATLWGIAALQAVNGASSAFLGPAAEALTGQTVSAQHLRRGVTLLRIGVTTASTLGAALGGLLLVATGTGWGFTLDAAALAAAAFLLRGVRAGRGGNARTERTPTNTTPTDTTPTNTTPNVGGGELRRTARELLDGWRVFRGSRWLLAVVAQLCFVNALLAGAWSTLGPVIARETFGRAGWGVVSTALALGTVLGGALLLKLRVTRMLPVGVAASALVAPALLVLGLAPSVPALVVCVLVGGAAVEVFEIGWQVSLQQNVPSSSLCRVFAFEQLGTMAAVPLGQLAAGPVAAHLGAGHTAALAGVLTLLATLATLGVRSVRTLEQHSA